MGLNNVGGDPPSAIVDAATIAARLNGPRYMRSLCVRIVHIRMPQI